MRAKNSKKLASFCKFGRDILKKNPQNFNMVGFSWQYLLHILFLANQECCCFRIKNQVYFSARGDPAKKLHNKHVPLNNHSVSARRQIQNTNNCERSANGVYCKVNHLLHFLLSLWQFLVFRCQFNFDQSLSFLGQSLLGVLPCAVYTKTLVKASLWQKEVGIPP